VTVRYFKDLASELGFRVKHSGSVRVGIGFVLGIGLVIGYYGANKPIAADGPIHQLV